MKFNGLPLELQTQLLQYSVNVVEIRNVDDVEELNLLFLRLNLGQILNAGERLNAMTGLMRDYVFDDIGKHDCFRGIHIPYRRYAKEQVAAQITLNYFSKKETNEFRRSRYIDLQGFFKERVKFRESDQILSDEVRKRLDALCGYLNGKLGMISSRAVAVSIFLFVSELMNRGRDGDIDEFILFLEKLLTTLKWQIPKGVQMHSAYQYLIDFQTHVAQAAGEQYAIQNRHNFLEREFASYQGNKIITGDVEYLEATKRAPDAERATVKL